MWHSQKNRRQREILFALLCSWTFLVHAEEYSAYFEIDSFTHSEPTAIKALTGDWDEQLYSGSLAFSVDRFESGVSWEEWRLGIFQRYDYFYTFSSDVAYLKYYDENHLQLNSGEQLHIYLSANSLVANGLSVTRTHKWANTSAGITLSYLNGKRVTAGSLNGVANIVSEKDYDLDFVVDYFYTSDELFNRQVAPPHGQGYSLDISVDWNPGAWIFKLNVDDLLARVRWHDTPRTIATGNTDTREYDENGYVIFNPAISGLEINQKYTQTLPRKIYFTSAYAWDDRSLLYEIRDYEVKQFHSIGIGFGKSANEHHKLMFNVTANALSLNFHRQWLRIGVTTDELRLHRARTFALEFSATTSF